MSLPNQNKILSRLTSLKFKSIAFLVTLVFLITVSLTWASLNRMFEVMNEELDKRGLSEATTLAYDAQYGLLIEDKTILDHLIRGRLNQSDITSVHIINRSGILIASNEEENLNERFQDRLVKSMISGATPAFETAVAKTNSRENIYYYYSPVLLNTDPYEEEFTLAEDECHR